MIIAKSGMFADSMEEILDGAEAACSVRLLRYVFRSTRAIGNYPQVSETCSPYYAELVTNELSGNPGLKFSSFN
jgi:hypothetical protein